MKWILTLCILATLAFAPQPNTLLFRQKAGTCQVHEWGEVACIRVSVHPNVVKNLNEIYFDVPGQTLRLVVEEHTPNPQYEGWWGHAAGHPTWGFALLHFADGHWVFEEAARAPVAYFYNLRPDGNGYDMMKIRCGG